MKKIKKNVDKFEANFEKLKKKTFGQIYKTIPGIFFF